MLLLRITSPKLALSKIPHGTLEGKYISRNMGNSIYLCCDISFFKEISKYDIKIFFNIQPYRHYQNLLYYKCCHDPTVKYQEKIHGPLCRYKDVLVEQMNKYYK